MSELTREQIEEMRDWLHSRLVIHQRHEDFTTLCNMALASLTAHERGFTEAIEKAVEVAEKSTGRRHICPSCGLTEIEEAETNDDL